MLDRFYSPVDSSHNLPSEQTFFETIIIHNPLQSPCRDPLDFHLSFLFHFNYIHFTSQPNKPNNQRPLSLIFELSQDVLVVCSVERMVGGILACVQMV